MGTEATWPPHVSRGKKIKSRGKERAAEGLDSSVAAAALLLAWADSRRRVRRRPDSWREGGGRERDGERERETSWREEDFPPPASSRDGSNFRREETRGEIFLLLPVKRAYARMQERAREGGRRERERAGERKTFLLPPLLATEAISVARRREERGEGRARERGRRNFPPPSR